MNEQLASRIRQCPNLPSLPTIAVQVLELAQRGDADMSEMARIVSRDPALSTKILRTVNSSFYGRSQNVSTISHALVILGLQSVKTLVLGFSLVNSLSMSKPKRFKHLDYWKRSSYAANAARTLAARIKLVQQEEAFLAALLQDIGMLVLDQVLGDEYGKVHEAIGSHGQLAAAEATALRTDHAEVGGMLAKQWNLPPLLVTPIGNHHHPEKVTDPALRRLTDVVSLSGICADIFVEQAATQIAAFQQRCMASTQLGPEDCKAILDEIGRTTQEVASLFEVNIGPGVSLESILKRANDALVELTLRSQQQASAWQAQATDLQQRNQKLKEEAETDALTGLANRRRFAIWRYMPPSTPAATACAFSR